MMSAPPLSYGAMAKYPWSQELVTKFSATSRFGDPIQLWEKAPDGNILLPRGVCPVGPLDVRSKGYPVQFGMKTTAKDADQARMYAEALDLLTDGQSFVIRAGTGKGKTWLGLALAAALGVPALVICTKDDLVMQWRQRILQHTDIPAGRIGHIQQDKCDVYGKSIVLASLKSMSIPDRYPPAIRGLFGLVIFDEVHRLAADTFQTVCRMFPAYWRLGLSATPERRDGKEVVFFANIGPVRVVGDSLPMIPKVLRFESGWRCPRQRKVDKETGEVKLVRVPHMPGKAGHVEKYLFRDKGRNRLLVWLMMQAYRNNRQLIIFSKQIEHLELLGMLGENAGIPGNLFGNYYGAATEKKLEAAAAAQFTLATPGKMGEGTDVPWKDAVLLAAPFANIDQIGGRAFREYPDKRQPVVFDVTDRDSPVFAGYENRRDEYYARVGAKVKNMVVDEAAAA
jgi:hypothetical protein